MNAATWGYAFGAALVMFLFFLIFLGLLALIPPLRQRFALRNVIAWLVSVLAIGYLTASGAGVALPLVIAALINGGLVGLRYWFVIRRLRTAAASPVAVRHDA